MHWIALVAPGTKRTLALVAMRKELKLGAQIGVHPRRYRIYPCLDIPSSNPGRAWVAATSRELEELIRQGKLSPQML